MVVTSEQLRSAIDAAKARGVSSLSKDRSVIARLPISNDLCCYLVSEDYDPRDARSISAAERRGRQQAWMYLDILRSLPGCDKAYLASTGPDFGTRESRHVNAVYQLTWKDLTEGRRAPDAISRWVPGGQSGTTAQHSRAPMWRRRTAAPTKSRCAA